MALYHAGPVLRTKPRANVLRGYTGNEPQSLSRSVGVAASQTIKSGQAIVMNASGLWILAGDNDGHNVVYLAMHDATTDVSANLTYANTDTDVLSSGKLLGLSLLGSYEIETGYYSASPVPSVDDWLAVDDAAPGNFIVVDPSTALARVDIVGRVTGVVDLSSSGQGGATPNGEDSSASTLTVIQFEAGFQVGRGVS